MEEVQETDIKGFLVNIYYCLNDTLFSLSEEDRSNPEKLRSIFSDLQLPEPLLGNFYAHVTNIAAESYQLPLDAGLNWAEDNAFSSYLYIEKGLVLTVLERLTDVKTNVFNAWYKLATMPEPRSADGVRDIIQSYQYTGPQIAKFNMELIKYERRQHPRSEDMNVAGWAEANAFSDYNRTRAALSAVLLSGFQD